MNKIMILDFWLSNQAIMRQILKL